MAKKPPTKRLEKSRFLWYHHNNKGLRRLMGRIKSYVRNMSGEEIQKELNEEGKKNKKRANGCLVVFLVIAGVIVYIGASSLSGSDSKNVAKEKVPLSIDRNYYAFTTDNNFVVNGTTSPIAKVMVNEKEVKVNERGGFSTIIPLEFGENFIKIVAEINQDRSNASIKIERITQEEKDKRKAELGKETKEPLKKSVLETTAEEIYSNYNKCQTDTSVEGLIRQKYDGKTVEITGIVEKTKDYYKDTLAAKQGIDTSKYIDENKRYEICLADNQGHACVVWVYSFSSQLLNKYGKYPFFRQIVPPRFPEKLSYCC